jgi:hypothetical protein
MCTTLSYAALLVFLYFLSPSLLYPLSSASLHVLPLLCASLCAPLFFLFVEKLILILSVPEGDVAVQSALILVCTATCDGQEHVQTSSRLLLLLLGRQCRA